MGYFPLLKDMLSILSFNILAPHFASPSYYPPGMDKPLAQCYRRRATRRFLSQIKQSCDILAFQEVTHGTKSPDPLPGCKLSPVSFDEYSDLIELLDDTFTGMFYPHDPNYWSEYGTYVPNGNALFFRRDVFSDPVWTNISLKTGNHAVLGEVTHLCSGQKFRVLNIHLDSESDKRRHCELMTALSYLSDTRDITDIILGDFNMGASDPYFSVVCQAGFRDVMKDVKVNTPTFSFMSNEPIDHIIYRDRSQSAIIPIIGKSRVLDNGIWDKYPRLGPLDIFAGARVRACLDTYGSDHLSVLAVFQLCCSVMSGEYSTEEL